MALAAGLQDWKASGLCTEVLKLHFSPRACLGVIQIHRPAVTGSVEAPEDYEAYSVGVPDVNLQAATDSMLRAVKGTS